MKITVMGALLVIAGVLVLSLILSAAKNNNQTGKSDGQSINPSE